VISIDGIKIEANASARANHTRRQLADEILAEAERQDAEEDERFGESRSDRLPSNWARRDDRRARIREALRQLDEQVASDYERYFADRATRRAGEPDQTWPNRERIPPKPCENRSGFTLQTSREGIPSQPRM
jgi:hypothetical protein